ncbi:hypothetical protein MPSEU_000189600 [Mayamaea pseudoterrestris]|nr:hypothetical protein MPSEU_000189600 [Mayamaea pseudoterrestris]
MSNNNNTVPVLLPPKGTARVKSVMSGDTVVLVGSGPAAPNVVFTLEGVSSPRLASKSTPADEPGAFAAREWLRQLVVGKTVSFETRKQGASAGDRVYGWLFLTPAANGTNGSSSSSNMHLAVECVRQGQATPKAVKYSDEGKTSTIDTSSSEADPTNDQEGYESQLIKAYNEAKEASRGIHSSAPLVRTIKTSGDDYAMLALVEAVEKRATNKRIKCVIEYVFDGSRFRCQVTDDSLPDYQYATFTLLLAGVLCPKVGNPRATPPAPSEAFAEQARAFSDMRLLQRELDIGLVGTDKSGSSAVGMIYHPAGNIAVELLKNGFAKMTDWSVRLMPVEEVPALRVAENTAKRTLVGIWHSYAPPVLTSASQVRGTVVEIISGDSLLILPTGKAYTSEDVLVKVSLASIRAPRPGNERAGRADEPYALECKEQLRAMTIGKEVSIEIHYERDIPIQPGVNEKRAFGTLTSGKHEDVGEFLVSEGLAVTQRHRDEDPKSARYDELLAAEAVAKAAKKGVHKEGEYKSKPINDLTDPKKAKTYSGSLMRAGTVKGTVDFVFNGALFKVFIPSENCHIRYSPNMVRCPQPSPSPGSKQPGRPGEPYGDEAKCHSRLHLLQRQVEIVCSGVTNSGIITGAMYVGSGKSRRDYTIELLGAGLATLDERKLEYGEVPQNLIDAQTAAEQGKVGVWSLDRPKAEKKQVVTTNEKSSETVVTIRLSEIRSGSHFYYHVANDDASQVMDESMKLFTQTNGTSGAPCDAKIGKVVAALFDDGTGKSWYRAKIIEKKAPSKVSVLFIDHGNVATVPIATHLRPLDMSLSVERIPAVAREAVLALTTTRSLETDEGIEAARFFQSLAWNKDLTAILFAPDETGKLAVVISVPGQDETINAQMIAEGLARVGKKDAFEAIASRMADKTSLTSLMEDLTKAQTAARRARTGMWRYGDVGDDDPADI